jgi:hypothetical protein
MPAGFDLKSFILGILAVYVFKYVTAMMAARAA